MTIPRDILAETPALSPVTRLDEGQQVRAWEEYRRGTSIRCIGRLLHRRSRTVSAYLSTAMDVDTQGGRAGRIGNTQRGLPKASTLGATGITAQVTPIQWAYIAGFFDGEGCLYLGNRGQNYRIIVTQKTPMVLCWLKETLGCGHTRPTAGGQYGQYRINTQRQVFDFLVAVYPYLVVKRDHVYGVLSWMTRRYKWESHATS